LVKEIDSLRRLLDNLEAEQDNSRSCHDERISRDTINRCSSNADDTSDYPTFHLNREDGKQDLEVNKNNETATNNDRQEVVLRVENHPHVDEHDDGNQSRMHRTMIVNDTETNNDYQATFVQISDGFNTLPPIPNQNKRKVIENASDNNIDDKTWSKRSRHEESNETLAQGVSDSDHESNEKM